MNRASYFSYIEQKLTTLSTRISNCGKLNLTDLHIHSETFFAGLLNQIFGWNLVNMNTNQPNAEGIDLIDSGNKFLVQVSSICTKQKIENSLEKDLLRSYAGYTFKFISIAKEASMLKKHSYENPHSVIFVPENDVIDVVTLLAAVRDMGIGKQKQVYDFIRAELGSDIELIKVDTNLANIINILSKENLIENIEPPELNVFEIEKKIDFNELSRVRDTINDYKFYYNKVNELYTAFDKEGSNKSFSVLQIIRKQYLKRQDGVMLPSDIFYTVIDDIVAIIMGSKNYVEIPYDELELCVNILVVDAFIRCKIFKNPEGYTHVIT